MVGDVIRRVKDWKSWPKGMLRLWIEVAIVGGLYFLASIYLSGMEEVVQDALMGSFSILVAMRLVMLLVRIQVDQRRYEKMTIKEAEECDDE